jgi:hypothetical protein
VEAPATYFAPELAQDVPSLCKTDPSACGDSGSGAGGSEILLTGPLAGAPAVRAERESMLTMVASAVSSPRPSAAAAVSVPAPLPAAKRPEQGTTFFDVVARLEIEVPVVADGVARVLTLARAVGGELVNESIEDKVAVAGASLSLRVPSARVHEFLDVLRGVGRVRSRRVESTELGRKERDAEVLLSELEIALKRYEELLSKAQNVTEMTAVEVKLAETRSAIERVKSDIAWMKDRVARSTVYVTLSSQSPEEGLEEPEPKLHPGVRFDALLDVPPSGPASTFLGGGVSMWFVRAFSFDLDLLSGVGGPDRGGGLDFLLATVGGELYSDFLGGGRRRWLNPYFGFRGGYAHSADHSQLVLGGSLGIEIFRSKSVFVDLQSRFHAFIGRPDGTHFGLQPFVGINFAY